MSTTQVTYKHRASQPLPPVERASRAGAHRDPRTIDYVIAAALLAVLATSLVVLIGRG